MIKLRIIGFWTLFSCAKLITCQKFNADRVCGILFSETNFQGRTFFMTDFDQSVNLKKDYRNSLKGWTQTRSIRALEDCTMTICSGTFFTGICHSVTTGHKDLNMFNLELNSLNCTCERVCSCDDISIFWNGKAGDPFGRAYIQEDCEKCYSTYVDLYINYNFPDRYSKSVTTFVVPLGCNLTVFSEKDKNGRAVLVGGPILKGFNGTVKSYNVSCYSYDMQEPTQKETDYLDHTDISELTIDEIFDLLRTGSAGTDFLGLLAASRSAGSGRSCNNAYFILIGMDRALDPASYVCRGPLDKIWECRIPIRINDLGIESSLVFIIVPINQETNDTEIDFKLMASIEEYLDSHHDLKQVIPNMIIIYNPYNTTESIEDDEDLQKSLKLVHELKVLDESYPNVMFWFDPLKRNEQKVTEKEVEMIEAEVNKLWPFPVNICFLPHLDHEDIFVMNNIQLENGEYFPRNVEKVFTTIFKMGEDPLGLALYKAFDPIDPTQNDGLEVIILEIEPDARRIKKYEDMFSTLTGRKSKLRNISKREESAYCCRTAT